MIYRRLDSQRLQPSQRAQPTGNLLRAGRRRAAAIPGLGHVLWLLTVSRLLVWGASLLGLRFIGNPDQPTPFHVGGLTNLFAVSARWDSLWYLQVAAHGYPNAQTTNFYPLYPLLIHALSWVVPIPVLAGLLLSWGCALAAGVLLYGLTELDFGETVARRTVMLLYLSPMAVFLTAVYTESLFLTLTVGCLYAARRERWWLAGGLAALASATRPPGVLVALPLLILYLYGPRLAAALRPGARGGWPRHRIDARVLTIPLAGMGLLAYLLYCAAHVGDFLEPFRVQQLYWTHYQTFPFGALWDAVRALPADLSAVWHHTGREFGAGDPISWTAHELIDFAFVVPVLWLLVAGWRTLPLAYSAYVLVNLALLFSAPTRFELLQSFDRYTLVLFPLYITAARRWLERPIPRVLTLSVSVALLCFFAAWFGAGKWVA
jgi:hypothetical protein